MRGLGVALGGLLFAAFVVTAFREINLSILFFAAFIVVGALSKRTENAYVKLFSGVSSQMLARGTCVRRVAIDKRASVKRLYALLSAEELNEVTIYDGKQKIRTLTQRELENFFATAKIYDTIEKTLQEEIDREVRGIVSKKTELPQLSERTRSARTVDASGGKRKARTVGV